MRTFLLIVIAAILVGAALAQREFGNYGRPTQRCHNGYWARSVNSCPVTCQTYPRGPNHCNRSLIDRCECNRGFILRNLRSRTCVRPRQCARSPYQTKG